MPWLTVVPFPMPESLTSLAAITKALASPGLSVVDCWASWCGPCVRFAPTFDAMSRDPAYEGRAKFYKVQDEVLKAEGSDPFGIRSLPTFILFLGGKEVARVRGRKAAQPWQARTVPLPLSNPSRPAAVWR